MDPMTTIARVIVAGGLTGARPALTLCLLQLWVALFADEALPPELAWMVHAYAIAAVAVAVVVEHYARSDPDLDEVMNVPNMVIGGVAGALTSVLLLGMAGVEAGGGERAALEAIPFARAGFLDGGGWTMAIVGALAASAASVGVAWVRRRLLAALDLLAVPARAVRWTETGTVAGALGLVLLVPVTAVLLAGVLVVGSVVVGVVVRAVDRRREELGRVECACGRRVRAEALVCPACGRSLEPAKKLGQRRGGAEDEGRDGDEA